MFTSAPQKPQQNLLINTDHIMKVDVQEIASSKKFSSKILRTVNSEDENEDDVEELLQVQAEAQPKWSSQVRATTQNQ